MPKILPPIRVHLIVYRCMLVITIFHEGPSGILFPQNSVKFLCIMKIGMFQNSRTDLAKNVLLMLVIFIFTDYGIHSRILETRLGLLEGITKEASHQKYFDAYYGIPYAKPPIGNLRFEPPVKAEPWNGVLNATYLPPPCPQTDVDSKSYAGQEDCLFLHVFTPLNIEAGANLPVIFYIFGGMFKQEYPARYGPDYFMSRDIVMVMTNYRLGALGFLSTGDTVIAGNMALKDQVMAMKWTKENIYDFGGDPHRVTLHGHSAGSTCVHLHTMSPLSAEYFHQAIMQSGWGIEPNMFWNRDFAKGISRAFAARLNCTSSYFSSSSMKECFLTRTAQELILAAENVPLVKNPGAQSFPPTVFVPVIEDENVEGAFLTENPLHASYTSNRKPWLLGITRNEGAASTASGIVDFIRNAGPKLSLPLLLGLIWNSKPNDVNFLARWFEVHFSGEEGLRNTTARPYLLVSKIKGGPKGLSLIEVVRKYEGLKYVYLFDYRRVSGRTLGRETLHGRFLGATHADELSMIFKIDQYGLGEEDLAFGDEMITRWINFAYSGDPNTPFPLNTSVFGTWDPVSSPRIEFLRIDRNGGMEKDYLEEEYGVWRRLPIFSKYFRTGELFTAVDCAK